jgi:hypothetical protein
MANIRNFHEKLERDLERVTAEIAKRREQAPDTPSREMFKHSLAAAIPPSVPTPAPVETPPAPALSSDARLPSYLSQESPEVKVEVERLVALALEEGITPAVTEAAKHSPFVLDALHDALVDKLLPELERRGAL